MVRGSASSPAGDFRGSASYTTALRIRLFRVWELIHQNPDREMANQKRQSTCGWVCEDQSWLVAQVHCLKLGASFIFKDQRVGLSIYYFTQFEQNLVALYSFLFNSLWNSELLRGADLKEMSNVGRFFFFFLSPDYVRTKNCTQHKFPL